MASVAANATSGRMIEGGFNHYWAIGQESFRLYRGIDKDEMKMLVPGGLHEEILQQVCLREP